MSLNPNTEMLRYVSLLAFLRDIIPAYFKALQKDLGNRQVAVSTTTQFSYLSNKNTYNAYISAGEGPTDPPRSIFKTMSSDVSELDALEKLAEHVKEAIEAEIRLRTTQVESYQSAMGFWQTNNLD